MNSHQTLEDLVENVNLNKLIKAVSKTHYGNEDYIIGLAYRYVSIYHSDERNTIESKIDFMYTLIDLLNKILIPNWHDEMKRWEEILKDNLKLERNVNFKGYISSVGKKIIKAIREAPNKPNFNNYKQLISGRYVEKEELNNILLQEYEILLQEYKITPERINKALN
jgi:hypothetical protein